MKQILLAVFVLFFASIGAQGSKLVDLGPSVGSVIPHDLSAVDSTGAPQSFETLKGEKGAVVLFFRSAKWCPFCQKQLIRMETITDDLKAKGYKIIGISYDKPKVLAKFKKRRKIGFPLLSDPHSVIIDAFGIRNTEIKEGHYAYGVPHPLIAVVDSDGVIRAKLFEQSYKNRPEVEAVIEAVDQVVHAQ